MSRKPNPSRVIDSLADIALARAKSASAVYSEYIRAHWQATGRLAPGCDVHDLIAWLEQNRREQWEKLRQGRGET